MKGSVKGMMVENAAGLAVLEPLDAVLDYAGVQGKTTLSVEATDVSFKLPLNVVRLVTRLGTGLSTAMKLGGGAVTARCTQFDRVWQTPPGQHSISNVFRRRCQVSHARWHVIVMHYYVYARRQMIGGMCQVADGRSQVTGGRYCCGAEVSGGNANGGVPQV